MASLPAATKTAADPLPPESALAPRSVEPDPDLLPGPAHGRWPLPQRLAFRFALCYFVIYVAVPEAVWRPVTTWMHENGLAPFEVIHQRTGSGDTGHDFAKLVAMLTLAAYGTIAWSTANRLVEGPRAHPLLGRWAHAAIRFYLAMVLLGYGLHKFYGGQFGELGPHRLLTRVGDLAPMTMVGTFMQASQPYEWFGGGGEVIAALLLIHRRTTMLGAMIAVGVMVNVAALNWLCGVPVKLFSAHLVLFGLALLVPFLPGLWALMVGRPAPPAVDLRLVRHRTAHAVLAVLGWLLVLGWIVWSHIEGTAPQEWKQAYAKGPWFGAWEVRRMVLDGVELAPDDTARWRWLSFERGKNAFADDIAGRRHFFEVTVDGTDDTAERTRTARVALRRGREVPVPETWTLEEGNAIAKVPVAMARTMAERWKPVERQVRSLVVRGTLEGKPLEVHAVEKVFPLQKGFLLRQELPEGW